VLLALSAGVPVLGEKPMADSMERARAMVAASERAGKLYMVSQSRRYNAQLQALRRLIVEHIGDLGLLNADFYIGPHFGGFRDTMASPLILDMAIHTFDAARYLTFSNGSGTSGFCRTGVSRRPSPNRTARNGVLDTKPCTRVPERAWVFRTVGYGHDHLFWKDLISALRLAGYDRVLSIEHEDSEMSKIDL
jgi:predicted dehydrogenase